PIPISYKRAELNCASGRPWDAACSNQCAAMVILRSTPNPWQYIKPKLDSASGSACFAASENHFIASTKSCLTTSPFLKARATRVCAFRLPRCACCSNLGHSRIVSFAGLSLAAEGMPMPITHINTTQLHCRGEQSTSPPMADEGLLLMLASIFLGT